MKDIFKVNKHGCKATVEVKKDATVLLFKVEGVVSRIPFAAILKYDSMQPGYNALCCTSCVTDIIAMPELVYN